MALDLQAKDNTNPADSDFPFGRTRDKTPTEPGTKWNDRTMSDYIQLFHKMMFEADVSYNGELDNEYSGWQFFEAFSKVLGRKYVKEVLSDFDGDVVTVSQSEISDYLGGFGFGGLKADGSSDEEFCNISITVMYLDGSNWKQMPIVAEGDVGARVSINSSTGLISVTLAVAPVDDVRTRIIISG